MSILFQACEYQEFEPVVLDDTDTISYSEIIQPMFEASCLGSGCHVSAGGVPPNLEADFAYLSLIGGNYVDTLNAEESTLYLRIEKDMPPSGALSDLQIEQVLLWIKQGAKEN
ncbi:MAG: hypothetical protein HQ500_09290 [Flavobacteriales bacterium]|nr:hypothetical protein [Flavobacteriales bacterium]